MFEQTRPKDSHGLEEFTFNKVLTFEHLITSDTRNRRYNRLEVETHNQDPFNMLNNA